METKHWNIERGGVRLTISGNGRSASVRSEGLCDAIVDAELDALFAVIGRLARMKKAAAFAAPGIEILQNAFETLDKHYGTAEALVGKHDAADSISYHLAQADNFKGLGISREKYTFLVGQGVTDRELDCSISYRVYARLGISETKFSIEAQSPQSCIYLVSGSGFSTFRSSKLNYKL